MPLGLGRVLQVTAFECRQWDARTVQDLMRPFPAGVAREHIGGTHRDREPGRCCLSLSSMPAAAVPDQHGSKTELI